ncbi:uncharacterized protein DSM5745_05145 [Aspergillus mulundensis]|uniref:Uncharacterized protein n=1 Tax=Aspergillus mulundensis TaxID=1810919 RepID=A0A3D8S5N4_9EURO|nr:hypothetical protein DSM5745_05145 [Aspergillus mulundensis]RDW81588.1 hypothetical protein DSM5745_05145 [Aspergillus mulundensis]
MSSEAPPAELMYWFFSNPDRAITLPPKLSFNDLPAELLILIAEQCDSQADILALAMTTKWTAKVLLPMLPKLNIKQHKAAGLTWAVRHNNLPLARRFLETPGIQAFIDKPVVTVEWVPRPSFRIVNGGWQFRLMFPAMDEAEYEALLESGKLDTPLYRAVGHGYLEMVRLLLEFGANPGTSSHQFSRSLFAPDRTRSLSALDKAHIKGYHKIRFVLMLELAQRGVPIELLYNSYGIAGL